MKTIRQTVHCLCLTPVCLLLSRRPGAWVGWKQPTGCNVRRGSSHNVSFRRHSTACSYALQVICFFIHWNTIIHKIPSYVNRLVKRKNLLIQILNCDMLVKTLKTTFLKQRLKWRIQISSIAYKKSKSYLKTGNIRRKFKMHVLLAYMPTWHKVNKGQHQPHIIESWYHFNSVMTEQHY